MLLVAAVTAVALVAGLGGCSVLGSGKITVTAYFTDSAGLFVGNDVGVLGVSVGKVTAITPDGKQVRVTMEVNKDQPVPAGAGAVVVSRSVATDRYVELTPVYQSGPRMQSGAVIPVDRTRTPVEFDQVLSSLGDFARGIGGSGQATGAIQRFLHTAAKGVKGKGALLNQSIHSLAAASNGIANQRDNATSTVVALDKLVGKLAANRQTVDAFVGQVSKATAMLASERTNFRTAIRSATKMIRVVAAFARQNRAQITKAVNQTNGVVRTVLDKKAQTAEILRTLPLTLQNLQRVLRPDGRLAVRLDFTALLPVLGPLLQGVCGSLGGLCASLGLDPLHLLDILGGLLGGKR